jgi:hypothetical protein
MRMKIWDKLKRVAAFLLAVIVLAGTIEMPSFAASTNQKRVIISFEGLTIGQGFYIEPKVYTYKQINDILEANGYETYSDDDITVAAATVAALLDEGVDFGFTGDMSSFYLSKIQGWDKGYLKVPQVLFDGMDKQGFDLNDYLEDESGDGYLGEFDYSFMAGWMITVNDEMLPVGTGQYLLSEDHTSEPEFQDLGDDLVIRWQFTLYGYGTDLGYSSEWSGPALFERATNKVELYRRYALCEDANKKKLVKNIMLELAPDEDDVEESIDYLPPAPAFNPDNTSSSNPVNTGSTPRTAQDVSSKINTVMASMATNVTAPAFGTNAGEWTVLTLARGEHFEQGNAYFEDYYNRIVETVKTTAASVNLNGALHKSKSTENARLIMALSSIGKDARNVGGVNLVKAYEENGIKWIKKQGINGPVFALIALNTAGYEIDETVVNDCLNFIFTNQRADGGWSLAGTKGDPDITSMTLQALSFYKDRDDVKTAAEKGITCLQNLQADNGNFSYGGDPNVESTSQVVVALTAWGINPDTDERFIKNGKSPIDVILSFYTEDSKYGAGFKHVQSGAWNDMATDQATYALVAYDRFLKGKTSLYDMKDAITLGAATDEIGVIFSVPEKIENTKGTKFNAIINLTGWDKEPNYRLMDCIIKVPDSVDVKEVKIGEEVKGGTLNYNLEQEAGKLRVVYFDPENGEPITFKSENFPKEFLNVSFELNKDISLEELNELEIALSGMSFKVDADSENEENTFIVDTSKTVMKVSLVEGLSFACITLYTGDGVDLIPEGDGFSAIRVTGVKEGAKITFIENEDKKTELLYNEEISKKIGVSTYLVAMDMETVADYLRNQKYTIDETKNAPIVTIGDLNKDGLINAQDALKIVNLWLRKTEVTGSDMIIAANVNADSRINTYDALGIVDYFVKNLECSVVNRAAILKRSYANGQ